MLQQQFSKLKLVEKKDDAKVTQMEVEYSQQVNNMINEGGPANEGGRPSFAGHPANGGGQPSFADASICHNSNSSICHRCYPYVYH